MEMRSTALATSSGWSSSAAIEVPPGELAIPREQRALFVPGRLIAGGLRAGGRGARLLRGRLGVDAAQPPQLGGIAAGAFRQRLEREPLRVDLDLGEGQLSRPATATGGRLPVSVAAFGVIAARLARDGAAGFAGSSA